MDLYAQNILDRYKEPYYKDKEIEVTHEHEAVNHSCGDKIKLGLRIQDSGISEYTFSGVGCAISMAAADILGDLVTGQPIDEVRAMRKEELIEALGIDISERRMKCALLAFNALKQALND